MFAQTTHVVAAPHGYLRRGYIFQVSSKSVQGFRSPGGQNLAFPITLASRFYNSLYYRKSRTTTTTTTTTTTPWLDPRPATPLTVVVVMPRPQNMGI